MAEKVALVSGARLRDRSRPELTAPAVLVTDSTHIYVLAPAAVGVHRFDRRGGWVETIGGEGDGPGEFRRATAMGWLSDTCGSRIAT